MDGYRSGPPSPTLPRKRMTETEKLQSLLVYSICATKEEVQTRSRSFCSFRLFRTKRLFPALWQTVEDSLCREGRKETCQGVCSVRGLLGLLLPPHTCFSGKDFHPFLCCCTSSIGQFSAKLLTAISPLHHSLRWDNAIKENKIKIKIREKIRKEEKRGVGRRRKEWNWSSFVDPTVHLTVISPLHHSLKEEWEREGSRKAKKSR